MGAMRDLVGGEAAIHQIETQEILFAPTLCDEYPLTNKPIFSIFTPSKSGLYSHDHCRILVLYAFGNG
jgi:hypothetical protein